MKKTIGTSTCKTCGIQFIRKSSGNKGYFCSKKCYGISLRGLKKSKEFGNKISQTKQAKSVKVPFSCEVCGRDMTSTSGLLKRRRTCSKECRGVLNSRRLRKMWQNPPQDLIDKMRAAMIKRRSHGRLEKETKPEMLMREELERRNITFHPQFAFGGLMVADFYIPYLQAFIFCDGSYWHGLPTSIEKDQQQVMYARSKGLKAYRFTDKEILNDVKSCVDTVLEDADQPFSIGEVIDKLLILSIKNNTANGDKLRQNMVDYRRMIKIAVSGVEYHNVSDPKRAVELIARLADTNYRIYMEVEKVELKHNTREDAYKLQDYIKERSRIKNSINEVMGNKVREVKVYSSDK
jgi:very-short-patch-repair endonuclease